MKQIDKYPHKAKVPVKQETKHNTKAGGSFLDKLRAYREQHAQSFFASLGRLFTTPFSSTMTVGLLAIAIALAGGFYLVVINLQQLTSGIEASNQISLFLREEVSEAHAKKFAEFLSKQPKVKNVTLITKQQAMAEFRRFSGFGDAIDALESNPLPIVIQVLPKDSLVDKEGLSQLLEECKKATEVEFAQLDLAWVERLQAIVYTTKLFAIMIAIILGLSVVFVAANIIRLEIHNRRQEIIIAKLVGGTNGFIQRPFMYTGFWIGFLSGVVAWFIVTVILLILRSPIENLSALYQGSFHLLFFSYLETLILIATSVLLTLTGSWLVLHFQIKQMQPE